MESLGPDPWRHATAVATALQPVAEHEGQFRAMEVAQADQRREAVAEIEDVEKAGKTYSAAPWRNPLARSPQMCGGSMCGE